LLRSSAPCNDRNGRNSNVMVTVSSAIMACVFAILCIPLTQIWGIEGTAGAVVVSGMLSHLVAITMAAIYVRQGYTTANGTKGKG
jgi:hypothetical protein